MNLRSQRLRVVSAILLCLFVSGHPAIASPRSEFVDIKLTPDVIPSQVPAGTLRADAKEVAQLLEIEEYVQQLQEAKRTCAPMTRDLTNKKLICLWRIMTTASEVRKISGRIDRELSFTNIALDDLIGRKNGVSNALNTLNFAQGGTTGIIKQSFVLNHWFNTSQLFLLVGAGVGTTLAGINLVHPYLWSRRVENNPNILAHFLDPKYKPEDAEVSYLWKFFNSTNPGSTNNLTRREVVIKHWEAYTGLNAEDENKWRKLAAHPKNSDELIRESIKVLFQRVDLLHDLQTHVEEIDGSLFELHKAISAG